MTRRPQVLLDGERGEQVAVVGNEHHPGLARPRRMTGLERRPVDGDRARVRREESGEGEQERGLAGTVGAEERLDGATFDGGVRTAIWLCARAS